MSWQTEKQMEREEDALCEALNRGEMTREQYNKELRELHRDYAAAARDAAQNAYDNELDRW